jgi:PHP family Zn ribbon phosphoesterase
MIEMAHIPPIPRAWSIDLHVHTPESTCYSEPVVTPEQIVDAAIAVGLEALAITDHNTTAAIDKIRSAADRRGLFIFPGAEISTAWGHVLGIFDLDTPATWIDGMLEKLGIPGGGRGDGTQLAPVGMEQVVHEIANAGGLAIAAHVDRWPSGLLHANASLKDKLRLLNSQDLSALEITVPGNKQLWNAGQVRTYPTKLACVQGSDAHATGEIGRRRVHVTMEKLGLAGMREALAHHENRIMFPDQR